MEENVRVFHSKHTSNRAPRVTIVGINDNGTMKFAAARCSKKDQFNRKKGRIIATGRLQTEKIVHSAPIAQDPFPFYEIAKDLSSKIIEDPTLI